MQRIKEEVEEMKKLVDKAQEEERSLAMSLLTDMKRTNKRLFILCILEFLGLLLSIGYTIYVLNDTETTTTEEIIEIQEVESVDNSDIQIGDR